LPSNAGRNSQRETAERIAGLRRVDMELGGFHQRQLHG
jgi:hypothetical protein